MDGATGQQPPQQSSMFSAMQTVYGEVIPNQTNYTIRGQGWADLTLGSGAPWSDISYAVASANYSGVLSCSGPVISGMLVTPSQKYLKF